MGRAIARTPTCPFGTFEESLADFAAAVYALRLKGGRCTEPGIPTGCGLYDPKGLYAEPPVKAMAYEGGGFELTDEIGSSYGITFVDVVFSSSEEGKMLVLDIEPARNGRARFSVQAWRLVEADPGGKLRPVQEQALGPEPLGTVGPGETLSYRISAPAMTNLDRIGLMVTRVDPDEDRDPVGAYTIRVEAG
jgi:hypothetical protein